MKNFEKFKTAKERYTAYCSFEGKCENCEFAAECSGGIDECALRWLDLEADEEKCLPCPFCGGEVERAETLICKKGFSCSCGYTSKAEFGWSNAIAAHNRVARAVMKEKEGEEDEEANH